MTKSELKVIRKAVNLAQDVIEELGTENYPYAKFEDDEICEMFYELNSMSLNLNRKIEAIEIKEQN